MSKSNCKPILDHLNRLEGQLRAIKKYIEQQEDCTKTLNLYSSFLNSAKSLNSKILIAYLQQNKIKLSEQEAKTIQKSLKI
jgi:DNA-binding FrmR family transcriptional regulator